MAFDGAFLHTVIGELNTAAGSFVDKIYQPSREEMVIHLKSKEFSGKLLIVARSGNGRIGLTESKFENPQTPPMFCMLLRKIFLPSRFAGAKQKGLERIIELKFEATNEMGDRIYPKIICEFISGSTNIIIADENNKIIDAVNRSDITAARLIMPGAEYHYPDNRGKQNILSKTPDEVVEIIKKSGGEVSAALLNNFEGLSPLVCREVCFSAFGSVDINLNNCDYNKLKKPIENLQKSIKGEPRFTILYQNGIPKDFSFIDISEYGNTYDKKRFSTAGKALDEFYDKRDKAARLKKQSGDLLKSVNNLLARANRRMNLRIKDLEATKDREKLRIYGELIKANIHLIKTGDTSATLQNFYDENLSKVNIKLDPSKSPAANAAKYFKDYKKSCAAHQSLGALIDADKAEIGYLDSVLFSLENAENLPDIQSIRFELSDAGYIRSPKAFKKKPSQTAVEEHISPEGYKIFVGHNNIQNDYITTKLADKTDTWFHTKNIHGAHVLLKNGGGEVLDDTIVFAARLAAKNSRAKDSSNVPVDYTQVKFVKKPAGSKAGMVIYTKNKTVFVTPQEL